MKRIKALLTSVLTVCSLTAGLLPADRTAAERLTQEPFVFTEIGYYLTVISCDKSVEGVVEIPAQVAYPPDKNGNIYYRPVRRIDEAAFEGCTGMTEAVIPEEVFLIDKDGFRGCTSLEKIVLPEKMESISVDAFNGCTALTEIVLPENLSLLHYHAFQGCTSLRSVTFTGGPSELRDMVFAQCSSLEHVVLSDSLTSIGMQTFAECTSLKEITIPESVTSIASSAFYGCEKLTIKGYAGSYAEQYAAAHEFPFISIGTAEQGTTDTPAETTVPATTTTEVTTSSDETAWVRPAIPGDTDGNGTLSIDDAVLMLRLLAETDKDEQGNVFCYESDVLDLNGDGMLTLLDAAALLKILSES